MTAISANYNSGFDFDQSSSSSMLICLLGQFQLVRQGMPVNNNSLKARQLLSALALQPNEALSRSYLLDTLWPDTDLAPASTLLRGLLLKLRRWFGGMLDGRPLVLREDDTLRLNLDAGVTTDVVEFKNHIMRGDRAARAEDVPVALRHYTWAADLYRGDLLAHSFADVEVEREQLRCLYLRGLGYLTHTYFDRGDYFAAIDSAQRMLRTNAYREDAHRIIMRSYVRRNERGQALRQFQVCQIILKAEFNIPPERETLALYEQIRTNPASV